MNNIEKIKAKIKRLMKETDASQFGIGGKCMCRIILDFIDSMPEEKPSEDLEEAAEERARKIYPYEGGTKGLICETSIPIFKAGFIVGAKWQKEQMLKDAVEGEVSVVILHENRDEIHYTVTYPEGESPHSITDKVRIIIVKED